MTTPAIRWCVADGSAHRKLRAEFVDSEARTEDVMPAGISELRMQDRQLEFVALNHVIYNMSISGGAATGLVQSLNRDRGPTAYLFRCLHCEQYLVHSDQP